MFSALLFTMGFGLNAFASPVIPPIHQTPPLNATVDTIPLGRWLSPDCPHPVPDVGLYPLSHCENAARRIVYPVAHGIIESGIGRWVSSVDQECSIMWTTPGSWSNPPIPVTKERLFLEAQRLIKQCLAPRGGFRGQRARSGYASEDPDFRSGDLFIALRSIHHGNEVPTRQGGLAIVANLTMTDTA